MNNILFDISGINSVPCNKFSVHKLPPIISPSTSPLFIKNMPSLFKNCLFSWSSHHLSSLQVSDDITNTFSLVKKIFLKYCSEYSNPFSIPKHVKLGLEYVTKPVFAYIALDKAVISEKPQNI